MKAMVLADHLSEAYEGIPIIYYCRAKNSGGFLHVYVEFFRMQSGINFREHKIKGRLLKKLIF